MLGQFLQGAILVTVTVAIHGSVLAWSMSRLRLGSAVSRSFVRDTWLLSRLAVWVVLAHLFEIVIWALFFAWRDIMPDLATSFYFSAVTYATIGYGDVVPPPDWRLVSSVEGLTGILMCAWSGGFFFAVAANLFDGGRVGQGGRS